MGRKLLTHTSGISLPRRRIINPGEATPTPGGTGYAGDANQNFVSRGEPTDEVPQPQDNMYGEGDQSNDDADGDSDTDCPP